MYTWNRREVFCPELDNSNIARKEELAPNAAAASIAFVTQFAAFGIDCDMLNWTSTYGKPNRTNHDRALELLKQRYY